MDPLISEDIDVGDLTVHLTTAGNPDRPPVLWLHGSGPGVTARANWSHALEAMADNFYNLAPDIIGFGRSTHPEPPPVGLAEFTALRVRSLVDMLDELERPRVDVVGNSMGAIIAVCMAIEHPERLRRIVLVGAGGAPFPPTPEVIRLARFYDDPTVESFAELLEGLVVDTALFDHDVMAAARARIADATRPELERSHRATFTPSERRLPISAETVAAISQPVLVVHGDQDRSMPLECGRWYVDHLPDARLHVMADAGHWLHLEHPETSANTVRDFLDG